MPPGRSIVILVCHGCGLYGMHLHHKLAPAFYLTVIAAVALLAAFQPGVLRGIRIRREPRGLHDMAIEIRPATQFEDVKAVVGPKRPDANVCWCLSYRIPSKQNLELRGPERGELVRQLTGQDPPPGVLAYDGDEVVGWAAVHPRADTSFARNRKIPHVDDLDVWSVWCIRVRPGHRGKGISHQLLAGRRRVRPQLRCAGHRGLPGRQPGQEVDLTMAYVGTRKLFEAAGSPRPPTPTPCSMAFLAC